MQPTVTAGSGLFSQGNAANTKSRTDARRMSTYSRWPMLRTTATSCLNRFGTVLTSLVSRSAARPVAPLLSTGRRGNSCVSPTQSTPVTTSTRHPSLKPSIAAQVQFSALPAGASTTRPRTPTTGLRSSSSRATGRSPRIGPGAAPTARSAPLNKCLDVTGGATASGTPLQLWDCNGTAAQEWRWRQQTRLVNPQSGRCLNVAGGSVADGVRLEISDCDDNAVRFGGYLEGGQVSTENNRIFSNSHCDRPLLNR
jgi:hypothetical protein